MTVRDRRDIKRLYFFNNYLPTSISRLYGLSHVRILKIIYEDQSTTSTSDLDCQLCSNDEAALFYIDGNEENERPQNRIMLCEACKRRIVHLQARRLVKKVVSQHPDQSNQLSNVLRIPEDQTF